MSDIRPFRGRLVRNEVAAEVVSPAHDTLSTVERRRFRHDHPLSYLHVTRSAADEPDAATVDDKTLTRRGRASLERLLGHGCFADPEEPAFYVYRLRLGGHEQLALVCEVDSEHFGRVARPHEATRSDRAALLAEHFLTVRAASSPIACAVRDDGEFEDVLAKVTATQPVIRVAGDDGLAQTVWRVRDRSIAARLHGLVADTELYIIDGHHRAAATRNLVQMGGAPPVLTAIFPQHCLQLVSFHRLVRLPPSLPPPAFVRRIGRRFRVEATSDVATVARGTVALLADGEWSVVTFDEPPVAGGPRVLLGSLDSVVLEREILQAIVAPFGPVDVTYTPDTEPFRVIAEAAAQEDRIPIFVPPVTMEDVFAVADGELTMPAKTTYFTPKVRSGLFLREYGDEELPTI